MQPSRPAAPTLRLGVLLARDDTRRGVELGVEEVARTAQLLGGAVTAHLVDAADPVAHARRLVRDADVSAFVADDPALVRALALASPALGVPVVNVGAGDDLRERACAPLLFHVAASERMRRDARAEPWHPTLERFGAAQLNDRFRARVAAPMRGDAWAGWFAVKALWESTARRRGREPGALAAALGAAQLDGHKGVPLSFRAWDRQLRQPLYLVAHDTVAAELPARAPGSDADAATLLDQLGASAADVTCTPDR